jgi:NhaP-type Na+/H+ or K+/H+ antiporter
VGEENPPAIVDFHPVRKMVEYTDMNDTELDDEEQRLHATLLYLTLFAAMLTFILIASKYLHENVRWNQYISEAALTLVTGTVVGFIVQIFLPSNNNNVNMNTTSSSNYDALYDDDASTDATGSYAPNVLAHSLFSFSPNVFFMALLPPILFNSGYQLRRELFYRHINPILLFACVGTTICAITTGLLLFLISHVLGWMDPSHNNFAPTMLEFITFGTLIAATDTVSILGVFQSKKVDPHLLYLVVGESALNDAVALVLFTTFASFLKATSTDDNVQNSSEMMLSVLLKAINFFLTLTTMAIGSPLLGVFFAFVTALIFKKVDLRHYPTLELPLYMLLLYTPFFVAECLHLSGIVAIFFCGIGARRYVAPNVSDETERNADVLFKLAAYVAEICIFLDMGLSVFVLPGSFNWSFIVWAFIASLLGRAVGIYPLAFLYNYSLKEPSVCEPVRPIEVDGPIQDGIMRLEICEEPIPCENIPSRKRISLPAKTIHLRNRRKTPEKRKDRRISLAMTHVLWFAGLRGAVAYACVRKFPNLYGHADEFTAAVIVIVLVSIVFMGGGTETLLRSLQIDMNVDVDSYMKEWHTKRQLKGPIHLFGTFTVSLAENVFTDM